MSELKINFDLKEVEFPEIKSDPSSKNIQEGGEGGKVDSMKRWIENISTFFFHSINFDVSKFSEFKKDPKD